METIAAVFAKVVGLRKAVDAAIKRTEDGFVSVDDIGPLHARYAEVLKQLKDAVPGLYEELHPRALSDGGLPRELEWLLEDVDYILEVRASSNPGAPQEPSLPPVDMTAAKRVFLSHGRSHVWREVQAYLEKDLGIETRELAQEPNLGRTVLQKLEEVASGCSYAVVVMTGDDEVPGSAARARENVMHEIGFFQGKYGLRNVCVLYQEGTSIPSNIHGLVYIPFPEDLISASFGALARELRAIFDVESP